MYDPGQSKIRTWQGSRLVCCGFEMIPGWTALWEGVCKSFCCVTQMAGLEIGWFSW